MKLHPFPETITAQTIFFGSLLLLIMILPFDGAGVAFGAIMIGIVLLGRLISVWIPVTLLRRVRNFSPRVVRILTWGGLRGGISVALALSLPAGNERQLILIMTYLVVVFSIFVQGLTLATVVGGESRRGEIENSRP